MRGYYSSDGGGSWGGVDLPLPPAIGANGIDFGSDPSLAFNSRGALYYSYIVVFFGEVSASLRNGAVRFANRSGSGSVSHVFREQGIHIVADTVAEVVADDAYSIQPGD